MTLYSKAPVHYVPQQLLAKRTIMGWMIVATVVALAMLLIVYVLRRTQKK